MVRHQTQGAGSRSEKKCRAQTHCSHPPPRPVGSASRPQNSDVATQMRFACRSGCGGVCLPAYLDILTYHLRILRVSVTGCTLMHLVDHSVRDPLCVPLCYIHVHLLRANAVHPRQPVCIGQPVLSTCPVHLSCPPVLSIWPVATPWGLFTHVNFFCEKPKWGNIRRHDPWTATWTCTHLSDPSSSHAFTMCPTTMLCHTRKRS